jgi:hypothetical protein
MKKESKPKVKITVKASTSPASNVGSKSVKPGSMVTNTKVVDSGSKKKPSTSYSPAPMSAKAKAKTRVAAAKKQPSLTSKVANRAKTVAREVRDIPTAVGTVIRATAAGKPKPGTSTPVNKQKTNAKYNLNQQLKEVKNAAQRGTKGTSSTQYGKPRGNR